MKGRTMHAKMVSEKILNLTHQAKESARPLEEIRSKNSCKGDTSFLCENSLKMSTLGKYPVSDLITGFALNLPFYRA